MAVSPSPRNPLLPLQYPAKKDILKILPLNLHPLILIRNIMLPKVGQDIKHGSGVKMKNKLDINRILQLPGIFVLDQLVHQRRVQLFAVPAEVEFLHHFHRDAVPGAVKRDLFWRANFFDGHRLGPEQDAARFLFLLFSILLFDAIEKV